MKQMSTYMYIYRMYIQLTFVEFLLGKWRIHFYIGTNHG